MKNRIPSRGRKSYPRRARLRDFLTSGIDRPDNPAARRHKNQSSYKATAFPALLAACRRHKRSTTAQEQSGPLLRSPASRAARFAEVDTTGVQKDYLNNIAAG